MRRALPPSIKSVLARAQQTSFALGSTSNSQSTRTTSPNQVNVDDDDPITTHGWIRSIRSHKNVTFLEIGDGSSGQGLQAVLKGKGRADGLTNGSSVRLVGDLATSRGAGQSVELAVKDLTIIGACDPEIYPIQKKSLPSSVLRDHAHLRFRTAQTAAVMRVRDGLVRDWHDWFEDNGFTHIHTPILTGSDCEGAGEVFTLRDHDPPTSSTSPQPFFPHPVHLTVSSQLHLEAPTHALSRTYTLSPSFRAEPSLTSRHLSEFYMLEAEVAWVDELDQLLNVVEDGVKIVVGNVSFDGVARGRGKRIREDLEVISHTLVSEEGQDSTKTMGLDHLRSTAEKPFARITYTSALSLLNELHTSEPFTQLPPKWGESIATEHEKRLASHFNGPVFVTRYPKSIKPFYMLPTSSTSADTEGETVECFDLLFPHWGEMAGGSLREHRLENLIKSIEESGMNKEEYQWYLDLRRFGTVPHGGWGMGLDRWVCWITGIGNIRDVVPFPRWKGHCKY